MSTDKRIDQLDTIGSVSGNEYAVIQDPDTLEYFKGTLSNIGLSTPDATSILKGKVQLSGDLTGSAVSPTVKNFPRVYNVKDGVTISGTLYKAMGDGSTDDSDALNHIMQYASDNGGGIMWFPAGIYMCLSSVWIRSYVTVDGIPGKSILTSTTEALYGILRSDQTNAVYDFTVRNVKFLGYVNSEPTVPDSERTHSPSAFHAIKINGSYAPDTTDDFGQPTSGPVIQNITIENITVQDIPSLPITIWGVTGKCSVTNSIFRNCKDVGFVYNEEVLCIGNTSLASNDNGFSLSRGNKKLVCIGNRVENAALFGIWLSGYNSDIGPSEFTCTGNVVKNTGRSCINLDFGPSNGIVSDNYLYQGYHRGPLHAASDSGTDGITIAGASGGIHATGLMIANNVIIAAARNGIAFKELDNSTICDNLIINPGTAFKANGTTPVNAGDTASNNGICPIATGSYSNVRIKGNVLIENRDTPLGNWPISSPRTGGTYPSNNEFSPSWRNTSNTLTISDDVMSGNPVVLQVAGGNGSDGGDTDVDVRLNMKGSGKFHVRNADGSGINNVSTSTSSAAKATYLFTAGNSDTNYIGAITAGRQDASSSSIMSFRPLRNSILASDGKTAPLWISGLPTNSSFVIGLNGGQAVRRTTVSDASYTALAIDYIIAYTSLTTGRTVTLKDATTLDSGQTYVIKDEAGTAGTNNITIATTGGQTIDGAATKVINTNYGSMKLYSNGSNWYTE